MAALDGGYTSNVLQGEKVRAADEMAKEGGASLRIGVEKKGEQG